MKIPWKLVGLAGLAGVAATGAVVARKRRDHAEYDPDELREKLASAFAVSQAAALETALNQAGVPAARVRDLGEYLHELYPQTPGISIEGEPVAFGPAFRWGDLGAPVLPPAPLLGADLPQAHRLRAPAVPKVLG